MTNGNGPLPLQPERLKELERELYNVRQALYDARKKINKLTIFEPELVRLQRDYDELLERFFILCEDPTTLPLAREFLRSLIAHFGLKKSAMFRHAFVKGGGVEQ